MYFFWWHRDTSIYITTCKSQLSGCSTARWSGSGLSLGDPTKVNAGKAFLFTDGSLKVENKSQQQEEWLNFRSLLKWLFFISHVPTAMSISKYFLYFYNLFFILKLLNLCNSKFFCQSILLDSNIFVTISIVLLV